MNLYPCFEIFVPFFFFKFFMMCLHKRCRATLNFVKFSLVSKELLIKSVYCACMHTVCNLVISDLNECQSSKC